MAGVASLLSFVLEQIRLPSLIFEQNLSLWSNYTIPNPIVNPNPNLLWDNYHW